MLECTEWHRWNVPRHFCRPLFSFAFDELSLGLISRSEKAKRFTDWTTLSIDSIDGPLRSVVQAHVSVSFDPLPRFLFIEFAHYPKFCASANKRSKEFCRSVEVGGTARIDASRSLNFARTQLGSQRVEARETKSVKPSEVYKLVNVLSAIFVYKWLYFEGEIEYVDSFW